MSIDAARAHMIQQQIRPQSVTDKGVLKALSQVPREDFVPDEYHALAFAETQIPLDHGQVMLNPSVEAKLLQALELDGSQTVLEIGTGSGYFTALLAKSAKHVYSVDCFESFTLEAIEKLKAHHIFNVTLSHANAENGCSNNAPYDAIIVTGSMNELPEKLKQQVNVGGRIIAIIGEKPIMTAYCFTRVSKSDWLTHSLFETVAPKLLNTPEPNAFEF